MRLLSVLPGVCALTFLSPFAVAAGSNPATTADPTAASPLIRASDPHFVYEGRFDRSDPAAPVVIWQASRIRVGFDGDAVALRFDQLHGQVFFDASVDGHTSLLRLPENSTATRFALSGYGPGAHQLVLFKRSEANAGTVRFLGVELPAGAKLRNAVVPKYARRMLFLGDSITVGACNEDGPEDQWADRSTHDAAFSYAALTAAAFNADHRNISVSGMGISEGWVPQLAGDTWDRIYPDPKGPCANLTNWSPAVVFLNFGENDDSFSKAHKEPFPATFARRYVALVRAVRRTFPSAEIVILRGGMFGGAQSERLRGPWQDAVAELEQADHRVSHFVFTHWSQTHPRIPDDHAMADELVAWLRQQPFMR